jgi:hypothetical protein
MEFCSFGAIFVDFSETRDLFGIIFKFQGPNCKIRDCRLILKKMRGLSAKCQKSEFPGIVFLRKTHGPSPRVRGPRRPGPPWTDDHCRARELTGARPSAAPVPKSSDQGVGEGKDGQASSTTGLLRVGRRWRGVSPAAEPRLGRAAVRAH